MAILTQTTILINGKEVEGFLHLKLTQSIHTHNVLEVHFPMAIFEGPEPIEDPGKISQSYLGSKISIEIVTTVRGKEAEELKFSGMITEYAIIRGENTEIGNNVVFTAKSSEVVTNDGPDYRSFTEMTLKDIVRKTIFGTGLKTNISPNFKKKLEYVVQHNESSYEFVQRLAAQYGEWLYFNEDTLYFGKPGTNEVDLVFNFDLIDYKVNFIPKSRKYKYLTNNYLADEIEETTKTGKNILAGKGHNADTAGNDIYPIEKKVWINTNQKDAKSILDDKSDAQEEAISVNQVQIEGLCTNASATIGTVATIEGEKYRITEAIHTVAYSGGYVNRFKGISGDIDRYPLTNINAFPYSNSQIAIVKDNADPEGLGRLKVKFAWQEESTPWIRLLVPHAGSNQGIQFFPEIDDQVLVDFEGGNAECPYVVGSLYHKNQKPSAGAENNFIKTIKTKGGSVIEFNDGDGNESITIEDKEGNSIFINTKDKDITITAGNNISLSAGADIEINAGGNLKLSAGSNMESNAGQKLENTSGTDYKITAGTNAAISAKIGVDIKGTAKASLEAPMVDINGTGMTNVKGGIVNLN